MDGALKNKFRISNMNDKCIIKLQEYCNFSPEVFKIPIIPKPLCKNEECHNNVNHFVNTYGGKRITGYYLITNLYDDNYGCAIYHSIWENTFGNFIDITPFEDNRKYNIFSPSLGNNYYSGIVYDGVKFFPYD